MREQRRRDGDRSEGEALPGRQPDGEQPLIEGRVFEGGAVRDRSLLRDPASVSPYALNSVRNKYGTYGGEYATQGAYNPYAFNPPRIIYQGNAIGYLSKNSLKAGAVDPDVLFATYGCS